MIRSALSGCCVLVLLALPGTAAAQDAGEGLSFRDDRPLTIRTADLARPGAVASQLRLCNAGTRAARHVRLSAEAFAFRAGGNAAADAQVLARPALMSRDGTTLPAGVCRGVALALADGAPDLDAGSYDGVVTAVAAGAGLARRAVTLSTGAAAAAPAPRAVVDTVKIKVVHNGFSPLHGGRGDQTRYIALLAAAGNTKPAVAGTCTAELAARTPSTACPAIGVAAHDEDTAQLSIGGATPDPEGGVVHQPVLIQGGNVVGDYTGRIDPGQTGRTDDAIRVTVSVTDAWWCALIALLIGVLLALIPQLWTRRWAPKNSVRGNAQDLVRTYADDVRTFRGDDPTRQNFPDIGAPDAPAVQSYADGIKDAVKNYAKGMVYVDTSTATYKEIVASIATARADAACWKGPGLLDALTALQAQLDALKAWLGRYDFAPRAPCVADTAGAVLARRTLEVGEAVRVKADAEAATALLKDWQKLATRLLELQLWWRALALAEGRRERFSDAAAERHAVAGARIAQAKRELVDATDADELKDLKVSRRIEGIYEDVAYLGARYRVDPPPLATNPGELAGRWQQLAIPQGDVAWLKQQPRGDTTKVEAMVARARPAIRAPARPAEVGRTLRILGDVFCIALALAVAIVGAMVALVDGKNFGTTGDYLTVIVVGTAAQATITSVVPYFNSFLSDLLGSPLQEPARPAGS